MVSDGSVSGLYREKIPAAFSDLPGADAFDPGDEAVEPNVTAIQTREDLPWAYLIRPETPVPTMLNPDCAHVDRRPNVLGDDFESGLFEGADTYHCGYFRGSYVCKMREDTRPSHGLVPGARLHHSVTKAGTAGCGRSGYRVVRSL